MGLLFDEVSLNLFNQGLVAILKSCSLIIMCHNYHAIVNDFWSFLHRKITVYVARMGWRSCLSPFPAVETSHPRLLLLRMWWWVSLCHNSHWIEPLFQALHLKYQHIGSFEVDPVGWIFCFAKKIWTNYTYGVTWKYVKFFCIYFLKGHIRV